MSVRYPAGQSLTENRRSLKLAALAPWQRVPIGKIANITYQSPAITTPTTANTKGAWVQVIASTSAKSSLLRLGPQNTWNGTQMNGVLMDVGVGAAGSEVVVIADLAVGCCHTVLNIPIAIPSGSRVAVRVQQSGTTAWNFYPTFVFYDVGGYASTPTSVDVLGTSNATSYGTALSGASGTWTEIVTSTSKDYQTCFAIPSASGVGTFTGNYPGALFHLGVGAAGSETILASGYPQLTAGYISFAFPNTEMHFGTGPVPAGSRLAVQPNVSSTNASRMAACIVGVPYV